MQVSFQYDVIKPCVKWKKKDEKVIVLNKGEYTAKENTFLPDNVNVVGLDPGKINLFSATNDDKVKTGKILEISSKERQRKIGLLEFAKKMEMKKKKEENNIHELENQIKQSHNFTSLDEFKQYLKDRGKVEDKLTTFYNRPCWRKKKWKCAKKDQRWRQEVVNELKEKFNEEGKQLVIAWGAWTERCPIKGSPPGPQVSLRRFVSKQIPVVCTSEYLTTKTCSHCGELTKGYPMINKEGNVKEVHGLRYCSQNSKINGNRVHFLSRDYNAAVNIRRMCLKKCSTSSEDKTKLLGPELGLTKLKRNGTKTPKKVVISDF